MDRRRRLESGKSLSFEGFNCIIDGVEGVGSNAIVYNGRYYDGLNRDRKHYVLIKELFPFQPNGLIYRDDDDNIIVDEKCREYYELHRHSFESGNNIHLKLLEKYPDRTGGNINTYFLNNTWYTVMSFSGGRSLEAELDKKPEGNDLRLAAKRMVGILDSLELFHSSGFLHMDISGDNVLLIGSGEHERVMLIDYNSVHDIEHTAARSHAYYSAKEGYSAPEVRGGHIAEISVATDIYSVGAVFYRYLSGEVLTQAQLLRRTPPDVNESGYLCQMPETVKNMVRKILCRSLAILPQKRYQSAEEMKTDFKELIDRIDGVGITHWALWEQGRNNILKAVKKNTALEYIKDTENLYRVDVLTSDKERMAFEDAIDLVVQRKKKGLLFEGAGGSGKTTALLKTIYNQSAKYTANTTAFTYISLYGRSDDRFFIRNKILENLHFKPEIKTFEMARHKLEKLISEPIKYGGIEKPKLVIFLDGLNEGKEDITMLVREIEELNKADGVGFIISSRSFGAKLPFETARVLPMDDKEVAEAVTRENLLLPESGEVKELIKTPLMLSVYIKTAKNLGKQITVQSKEELIRTYIEALCKKETQGMSEDDGEKWFTDACVWFLLPMIAKKTAEKKRPLNDKELLKIAKKCRRIFSSKIMIRAFPEWIGHSKDIINADKTADEWYGMAVQKLLWQRMGLLSRKEDNTYGICHQIMADFFVSVCNKNRLRLMGPRALRGLCVLLCVFGMMSAFCMMIYYVYPDLAENSIFVRLNALDKETSERIIEYAAVGYQQSGAVYEYVDDLLKDSAEGMWDYSYNKCVKLFDIILSPSRESLADYSRNDIADSMEKTDILSPSYKEFDSDIGIRLVSRPAELAQKYSEYIKYISYAIERNDSEYISALREVLEADADLSAALYHYCCNEHMRAMDTESEYFNALSESVATMNRQEKHRESLLKANANIDMQTIKNLEKDVKYKEDRMQNLTGKYEVIYRKR